MSATKTEFIAKLAAKSGLTLAQAEAATNALPEAFGEWLHDGGASGPGSFTGEIDDNFKMNMTRTMSPNPHWILQTSLAPGGLTDFGNGSARFGLPVENG